MDRSTKKGKNVEFGQNIWLSFQMWCCNKPNDMEKQQPIFEFPKAWCTTI